MNGHIIMYFRYMLGIAALRQDDELYFSYLKALRREGMRR